MNAQILKLSNEDVKLLKKNGYFEEAGCNGNLVTKKTALTIYKIVKSLKRKENGASFGL